MFYIGVHCSNKIRDNYMGSGCEIKRAIKREGIENFEKDILEYFKDDKSMLKREREIVDGEFILRDDTYNRILGGGKLNGLNNVVVKDINGNKLMVSKNDPRYLSGELVGVSKNTIVIKDKTGKIFRVNKNDPRYLSGELVGVNSGIIQNRNKVYVRDNSGNAFYVYKDDVRLLSGEIWERNGKRIWVTDGITKFRVYENDPILKDKAIKLVTRKKYTKEEYLAIRTKRRHLKKKHLN